jgi:hypothetical protein
VDPEILFGEKTRGRKTRETVPYRKIMTFPVKPTRTSKFILLLFGTFTSKQIFSRVTIIQNIFVIIKSTHHYVETVEDGNMY